MKKRNEQSVSNFYTKIKRKGLELKVDPALIKQAFCQGLSRDIQKHCALKQADTIEEYFQAALEYEKISQIGEEKEDTAQALTIEQKATMTRTNQAEFLEEKQEAYVNYSANGQQRNNANFSNNYSRKRKFNNNNNSNNNRQCIGCGGSHHGLERGSREAYCTAWGKTAD